jgi:hypothetical protein
MMKPVRILLAIVALLALGGCFPSMTSHPIGTTVGLKVDPALLGTWKSDPDPDNKRISYYHFLTGPKDTITAMIVPDRGEASDIIMMTLTTAHLGKSAFMNVRVLNGFNPDVKDQPPGSIPVLYSFGAKGTLTFTLLDEDKVKDAIKTHKIAGDAGEKDSDDATITADGPALDKFFLSPVGLALFQTRFVVLHKID